ncbi:MAG: energy-coupling factor transporter ATPase [Anaerovoracaceae bacterium]|jgi:energy-coupling factor transport system ATP-binding protein
MEIAMDMLIRIDNLILEYTSENSTDCVRALDGVSIDIEAGSFVAIIGRNGSGKSTLAKTMNALLLPTEGDVLVGGYNTKDDDHIWDIRQTAAMVFQNPDNQIVSSIVEDDVAFGPENLGIEARVIRERVDKSLEAVKMGAYRKKAPHMLSGGQKQRIAIAGAIAMKPRCIIFDEPTAMLDPSGRGEVLRIINTLHSEGITCILITHFMEEAAQADRIIIMNGGHVDMDGTPKEIFAHRERLKELSLDVPLPVELAWRLRKRGIDLPENITSEEELISNLCRLKYRT